jgi:hypothetical protein
VPERQLGQLPVRFGARFALLQNPPRVAHVPVVRVELLLDQLGLTYRIVAEDNLMIITDVVGSEDPNDRITSELRALHRRIERLRARGDRECGGEDREGSAAHARLAALMVQDGIKRRGLDARVTVVESSKIPTIGVGEAIRHHSYEMQGANFYGDGRRLGSMEVGRFAILPSRLRALSGRADQLSRLDGVPRDATMTAAIHDGLKLPVGSRRSLSNILITSSAS